MYASQLLLVFLFCFILETHWVQTVQSMCSPVWGQPLDCGQPTRGHTAEEHWLSFLQQPLPALNLSAQDLMSPSHTHAGRLIGWTCTGLIDGTTAAVNSSTMVLHVLVFFFFSPVVSVANLGLNTYQYKISWLLSLLIFHLQMLCIDSCGLTLLEFSRA